MDKVFTIVGVSTQGKVTKFRVANGDMAARVKVLERNGHTDISSMQLTTALDKMQAIAAYEAAHPETTGVRKPNEKTDVAKTPRVKTVTIKTGSKVTDAATTLLNEVNDTDETVTV